MAEPLQSRDTLSGSLSGRLRLRGRQISPSQLILPLVLGVMWIAMTLLSDVFLTPTNLLNLLRQVSIVGIIAVGETLVMVTGGFDLSVGAVAALAGMVAAMLQGQGLVISLGAGLVVGLGVGAANGLIITKGRVNPFVTTLGMMTILRGIALVIVNGKVIYGIADWYKWLGQGALGFLPSPVLLFLIVTIICHFILKWTRFGRYIYALGGNEEASHLSGISTTRIKIAVYSICGLLAAFSGMVLAGRINSANPISATGYELDAIAAVIVGGTRLGGGVGSVIGTIVGTLILGTMTNGLVLLNVEPYYQQVIKGVIIILAVAADELSRRQRR